MAINLQPHPASGVWTACLFARYVDSVRLQWLPSSTIVTRLSREKSEERQKHGCTVSLYRIYTAIATVHTVQRPEPEPGTNACLSVARTFGGPLLLRITQ